MDKHVVKQNQASSLLFPPVVAVLGHVDHGKTTLLDALRTSDIAKGEAGGITQRIGASEIEVMHEGVKRRVTLIDTPGHEAFSNMRQYGVTAADIVLLVVAADDGVMPQTRESIEIIRASNLPFIVVFTKKDVPGANIEKAKQTVAREKIQLEGVGGDVPFIAVSAVRQEGIKDLLDLIFLVWDMGGGHKKMEGDEFLGIVIESKLDKRRGSLSTIVVKRGSLSLGDRLFQESEVGKVRAITSTRGIQLKKCGIGDAVEILGISSVLTTGSILAKNPLQLQKKEPHSLAPQANQAVVRLSPTEIQEFFGGKDEKALKIVLKTEGHGEWEAIKNSLPSDVLVVYEGQGDINVSDILLAKDFGAIVVGFNVSAVKEAKTVAEAENVIYRTYSIIYKLLEELADASKGAFVPPERILGEAEVIASFIGTTGIIIGAKVIKGRLVVGDSMKLMRGEKELGRSKITSLRRGKQEVKEVAKNLECGIMISPPLDFVVGDMVLSCSN